MTSPCRSADPPDALDHLRDGGLRDRDVVEERRALSLERRQRHPPRAEKEASLFEVVGAEDALRRMRPARAASHCAMRRGASRASLWTRTIAAARRVEIHPRHLVDGAHRDPIHDLEQREVGDARPSTTIACAASSSVSKNATSVEGERGARRSRTVASTIDAEGAFGAHDEPREIEPGDVLLREPARADERHHRRGPASARRRGRR